MVHDLHPIPLARVLVLAARGVGRDEVRAAAFHQIRRVDGAVRHHLGLDRRALVLGEARDAHAQTHERGRAVSFRSRGVVQREQLSLGRAVAKPLGGHHRLEQRSREFVLARVGRLRHAVVEGLVRREEHVHGGAERVGKPVDLTLGEAGGGRGRVGVVRGEGGKGGAKKCGHRRTEGCHDRRSCCEGSILGAVAPVPSHRTP